MLLSVANLKKSLGADKVLTGVTFRMEPREKVALVGRNGCGKTTLLKLLTKQYEPDGGSVAFGRGVKIGYLRQEGSVGVDVTVLQEAQAAQAHRLQLQARLAALEEKLAAGDANQDDLDEYALVHEHFLESEGYSTERDVRVVLNRMGFDDSEFEKSTNQLSGGERTRLALARLLLEEPDLLILDEPTNHLDLQATEWLERWVGGYHGAVLLVSHDRRFLEATAERVLDMRDGGVTAWPGPFAKYLELKRESDLRQAVVAKQQAAQIAKMDEYVRRFMNSQRTAQARGRQKLMNRLIDSRIEAPKRDAGMKAGFSKANRSGDLVIECKKLSVGFGDTSLIRDFDWTVRYGDRWGVIGENGAGKSTLLKAVLGLLEPQAGSARLGAGVVAGYFAQDAETLDPDVSPLDLMVWECDLNPDVARNLLGRFLIEGDDVFRPIRTLSGGEKNKLSLARLTVLNPNLLVLDEPTNHLDMASREALAQVLKEFTGTLVLVSHDRWLLGEAVDNILDIRHAGPVTFPGGYADYRRRTGVSAAAPVTAPPADAPTQPSLSPHALSKEIQRVERLVQDIEVEVAGQEGTIEALERRLADLRPTDDVLELTSRHGTLQEALAGSLSAWEEQSKRLDALRAQQLG
ncbi:MAG: ABC-F family ATP-binding cassette domain-containing protein [Fimbriimonadaceae bacterium]